MLSRISKKPNNISLYLLISIFHILLISTVPAQTDVKFRHLSIEDGLSQNAVFTILQDSKGFMWFGTKDGLNRYDGYSFTVFNNIPFDTTSISDGFITELFEDSRGFIWIGTMGGGINVYNYQSGEFKHINFRLFEGENNFEVTSFTEDADSNIWFGTKMNGLFRLNIHDSKSLSFSYKQFLYDPESDFTLNSNQVSSVFKDSSRTIWAGTANGLNRFNSKNENFYSYPVITKNKLASSDPMENGVTDIYEDYKGRFWLGTLSGLVLFNRTNGSYTLFKHQFTVNRFGWGNISGIVEEKNDKLWLATAAGLMCFDIMNRSYDYFKNDPYNSESISYDIISSICTDRTGLLWIGTAGGGINIYNPNSKRFSTFTRETEINSRINGFSIRSIFQDNSGNIWISTDVLYCWNRKTGRLKSFENSSEKLDEFGNTGAYSIIQSSDGTLWFATVLGLYGYDPITGKITHHKFNPADLQGLPEQIAYTVFEDIDKNIWVITAGYFCKMIDKDSGKFISYRFAGNSIEDERLRSVVCQDSKKRFWLGTKSGLLQFDEVSGKFTEYRNDPSNKKSLNNNFIKSLCPDPLAPDNVIWIGTAGGGLNCFNIEKNIFTHYLQSDGLPNNVVYGILTDKNNNLWLSTNKGLSRFNIETKKFRNFNISDGLNSNEFNTGAYYKSRTGEMFFGSINGLNYFFPEEIIDNRYIPEIAITDYQILDRHDSFRQDVNRKHKVFSKGDHLILSYEYDILQFRFASLDFSAPEKNKYAYMLEDFNKDWIYSGSVNTVTYTNLSPGDYVFRVKGSNNDGIWNDEGTTIYVTIVPPWWNTWWSYSLYGLILLFGLYVIRRYELNRVSYKNQLKLEKVESITLRNLDQMKSRFFANISHEFRTPLTLILGQIDNVMTSNIETKEKAKLQVANRNARRLLTLINQLLDLSKLEAGSMELNAEQHNLVSFLKSLFYSFESIAESNNITLKFESEYENIPVVFDPDKMEKVFYNLVSNAMKFTPAQGEIKVSLKILESSEVEVKVKDNGIGISADRLEHIFDRFYHADNSSTREHEGTGIGLALAKELVELHKGTITAFSVLNEGTEFIIKLPAGDLQIEKEQLVKLPADNFSFENIDTVSETFESKQEINTRLTEPGIDKEIILIVEDNADVRSYICEQLENDYHIIRAADGEQGILKAVDQIPDLIITDVMMPKMDGYLFSKAIRANEKTSHIPIIMLTAKAGLDDKIEGLETGIDDYLTKPFSAKELKVRVNNLIYQRKQLKKRFSKSTLIKPTEVSVNSVDQVFLQKAIKIIESNFENVQFGVESLANELNMSQSQLNRKLNALVDQPAGQLIRSLRLQHAADLLKHNTGSVAEICYKVGFNDQAYFSRAFKKQFGQNPTEYKKTF